MEMPGGGARGRPPIPPDKYKEFIDLIKAGNYIETACAVVGVSKGSVYKKLREGRNEESEEAVDFLNAVKKAMAESESRDVVLIGRAAEKNWTAAAWRLERKYERWRRKDNLSLTHSGAMGVVTKVAATPEEMEFFKANFGTLFPDLKETVTEDPDEVDESGEAGMLEDFLDEE